MAGTLTITDGTVSVNLYDPSTLYLSRRGWSPGVAVENAAGDDYEDVEEVINCEWMQTTDDTRDATLHNLNYLAAKARNNERQRKLTDPVYFSLNTPSESNVRYGVIKDINVPKLDAWHYGPSQPLKLAIVVRRDGAWRRDSPLTTPQSYPSLMSQTIYNRSDGSAANYLDVAAADVKGDAFALPVVQVSSLSAQQEMFIMALRSRVSASEVTNFEPHFNTNDFGDGTYLVSDSPYGKKWERSVVGTATMDNYTALPAGFDVYSGTFLLYAVVKASTAAVTLQIGHSVSTGFGPNASPVIPVPLTTNYMPLYMGRITLPPPGRMPGVSNPTNYYFNLRCDFTGSAVFSMRNFYLVPVDDGIFSVGNAQTHFCMDSILERSWPVSSTGKYIEKIIYPKGRYLRLKPAYNHRLMFFYNRGDAGGGVNPADSADINLRATLRYLALRGNT